MEIKWWHQRFWTQVSCNLLQKSLTKLWAQTQLNSDPNQCHKINTGPRKCTCFTSIIWQPWMTSRSSPHSMPRILYLFVWTGETLLVSGSFPQKLSSVSSGKCHIARSSPTRGTKLATWKNRLKENKTMARFAVIFPHPHWNSWRGYNDTGRGSSRTPMARWHGTGLVWAGGGTGRPRRAIPMVLPGARAVTFLRGV